MLFTTTIFNFVIKKDFFLTNPNIFYFSVSRTHSQGPEDPAFAMGQYPHQGTLNNKPQRRSSSGIYFLLDSKSISRKKKI